MGKNTVDGYLKWITPKLGDPTYSLLKAHLLFEELLRAYLKRVLPNPDALDGARLTFAQVLAIARASSAQSLSDYWIWKGIGELNSLRNMLAHQTRPKNLADRLDEFSALVASNIGPFPPSAATVEIIAQAQAGEHLYTKIDMATIGLYGATSSALGFDVDAWLLNEEELQEAVVGKK